MPATAHGESVSGNENLLTVIHDGENNYFKVAANPGQEISLVYCLYNNTEKEITNSVIIYDSRTAVNGGNVIMSPENMMTEDTGSWFNENLKLITMGSGESKNEEMILTVPDDCEPGVYTAIFGLYSKSDEDILSNPEQDEIQLDINSFYTSTLAIVVEVGKNPFRSMEFGDEVLIEADRQTGGCFLYVPVINNGNAYEFPVVSVEVIDKNLNIVYSGELAMDIVYRRTDAYACFYTEAKIPAFGEYTINARMRPAFGEGFSDLKKLFVLSLDKGFKEQMESINLVEAVTAAGEDKGFFIISKSQVICIIVSLGVFFITVALVVIFIKRRKQKLKTKA